MTNQKKVNSVAEFLDYVNSYEYNDYSSQVLECSTFFRGQSNIEWKLTPSLYRENLLPVEGLLLKRMKHLCPAEFADDRLEVLAKMQHFGMPTRMLDVTTNPLVALYFACSDKSQIDKDGVVYSFCNMPVMWSNDPIVETIMDFVFELSMDRVHLDRYLNSAASSKSDYFFGQFKIKTVDELLRILTHPAYAVMPVKSNPRIFAQNGAFLIFGMKMKNINPGTHGTSESYTFEPLIIKSPKEIFDKSELIIVPSGQKKIILNELNRIGINEQTLFPDLQHQVNHVVNSVRDNFIFTYI